MKTSYCILIGLCLCLYSCEEQEYTVIDLTEMPSAVITKVSTSTFDECTEGYLPSGKKVALPWGTLVTTSIPDDIRNDVKMQDGWVVLDTTVDFVGYSTTVTTADDKVNYILLYNTQTGVLKGFYYADTMIANSCGFWHLTTSSRTKLFNFVPYFAESMDSDAPQEVILGTINRNGVTDGFEQGWNCFMQELSYDDNSLNQRLNISAFAMNKTTITLQGAFQSKSNGTIVSSTGQKSYLIDGLASGVGAAGKQWVIDNTKGESGDEKRPIKYIGIAAGTLLEKGISGFITAGLNKVFGSLLGTTKTSMDLNFTTNGKATISGELVAPSSGFIPPVTGLKLGGGNMNLGIWNLETKPIYEAQAYAELDKIGTANYGICFHYKLKFTPRVVLKKNPAVKGSFSYAVKSTVYEKYKGDSSPLYQIHANDTKYVYPDNSAVTLYEDSLTTVLDGRDAYTVMAVDLYPNKTSTANVPSVEFKGSGFNIRNNTVIKVLTTLMITDNGKTKTIYSSKSFVPEHTFGALQTARPYRWTLQELRNYGYKW